MNIQKQVLLDKFPDVEFSKTYKQHQKFVTIKSMPFNINKTEKLIINFSFFESCFGDLIIASTSKGVCYLAFNNNKTKAVENLKNEFPNAIFSEQTDVFQQNALLIFQDDWTKLPQIKLHLKGTDFQLKIWNSLLKIPFGKLVTYKKIAHQIEKPKSYRAVGTAIGGNPVAFIIPCHRVISSSGKIGGYRWETQRKVAIINYELSQIKTS